MQTECILYSLLQWFLTGSGRPNLLKQFPISPSCQHTPEKSPGIRNVGVYSSQYPTTKIVLVRSYLYKYIDLHILGVYTTQQLCNLYKYIDLYILGVYTTQQLCNDKWIECLIHSCNLKAFTLLKKKTDGQLQTFSHRCYTYGFQSQITHSEKVQLTRGGHQCYQQEGEGLGPN